MKSQNGSALVYILIAIALLAALTASFMQPGSQQVTSQNIVKAVSEVSSQINFIRSAIQECVLNYPGGDDGLTGQINFPFPINPSSDYFDTATPPAAANDQVRNIRCPGNPGGASRDHAAIFGGMSGKFLQPAPTLFEEWEYYSGANGVYFYTYSDKTDAFLTTALEKLDENFSECESDIIVASGSDVEMTTTATATDPKCTDGNTCFRVWMIIRPGSTNAYQAGSDEHTANCGA